MRNSEGAPLSIFNLASLTYDIMESILIEEKLGGYYEADFDFTVLGIGRDAHGFSSAKRPPAASFRSS